MYNFKTIHYQLLKLCSSLLNQTSVVMPTFVWCLGNKRRNFVAKQNNEFEIHQQITKAALASHHCSSVPSKYFSVSTNATLMLNHCFLLCLTHSLVLAFAFFLSPCFLVLKAFFFILRPDLYLDFLVWSCHNAPCCQHL